MGTPGRRTTRGTELRSAPARRWFGQHYTSTRSLSGVNGLIAVTGATGVVGGRVARRLAERGVAQRLVVRDPAARRDCRDAEVRVASGFGSGDQMRAALAGAGTLFLVPAEESAERVDEHRPRSTRRSRPAWAGSSTCRS